MACYHPLYAIRSDMVNVDTGKNKMIIIKKENLKNHNIDDLEKLPCGNCIGCRLDYSRMWALRCMLEAKQYKNNYFITLTYDDINMKFNQMINTETGEIKNVPTLCPKDLQKFIKKLRRHYEYKYNHIGIRFYACGEYGSKNNRPHFHIILFNIPIFDLKAHHKNALGDNIYTSDEISKIWNKGIIGIGEVTYQSVCYTARYMTKKHKGLDKNYYKNNGLYPEFSRMSRKPGIGREYYEENKHKIYDFDEIMLSNGRGKVLKLKPPKYYDDLYDIEVPAVMKAHKAIRKEIAKSQYKIKLDNSGLKREEFEKNLEKSKIETVKYLTRRIE